MSLKCHDNKQVYVQASLHLLGLSTRTQSMRTPCDFNNILLNAEVQTKSHDVFLKK